MPFLKIIVRHTHSQLCLLTPFLLFPSCNFKLISTSSRSHTSQKTITTFYRVIILLVLTLQDGILMDNVSAMPRAKGHSLSSAS